MCGSIFSLGMRLPRKSRDKTRTLHACVWCVLCNFIICCVKNMLIMVFMCLDCLCVFSG